MQMIGDPQAAKESVLAFGAFRFFPARRLLREGDRPIRLGSRALHILSALVECAGELVGKKELIACVWPNTKVEEATLRVHVAALRKVLGDGYVQTVTGQGYRFVAPVTRLYEDVSAPAKQIAVGKRRSHLPVPITRMIGRSDVLGPLATRLSQQRCVTITGPGGIGKTTVALAAADALSASYLDGCCFVDLASINDARLVPSILGSALGLEMLSDNPIPVLNAFLRDKQVLVVLDNCEHVISAAAALAETLLRGAPGVHILATSREPLRCEGEWVHRLSPLETPPPCATLTVTEALTFSAIQLFAERASASCDSFELCDADAPIVADLCRRLDGIPLAIELAAARVDLFGVWKLAAQIGDHLTLLTAGRRTAAPRHQTLRATLDWSYGLLSDAEQNIFRRLAIFPGAFDLASACAIVADGNTSTTDLLDAISSLVAKSLIAIDVAGEQPVFWLLDTTRAYALEKLDLFHESAEMRRRHAELCCTFCEGEIIRVENCPDWLMIYGRKIEDVRAALNWCFSSDGDVSLGVKLAAASAPLWFRLSVVEEYRVRLEWALRALKAAPTPNAELEMTLNQALAPAVMIVKGPTSDTMAALHSVLDKANLLGDTALRWRALADLSRAYVIVGDYPAALDFAEKAFLACPDFNDDAAVRSDRLLAMTHHFAGNQTLARHHVERALTRLTPIGTTPSLSNDSYQLDHLAVIQATLGHILWFQGRPNQAVHTAHRCVEHALSVDHALSLCFALCFACRVLLWAGDIPEAERLIAMLLEHASRHSLAKSHFFGRCYAAAVAFQRDDTAIADCHQLLHDPLCRPVHLEIFSTLSTRLISAKAFERAETGRAGWCAAEILRAQGEAILAHGSSSATRAAETLFRRSLGMARQQEALSWELRAAMSLARLCRDQGRIREAHNLLSPVYARFTEGFGTTDLMAAETLLAALTGGPDRGDPLPVV